MPELVVVLATGDLIIDEPDPGFNTRFTWCGDEVQITCQ